MLHPGPRVPQRAPIARRGRARLSWLLGALLGCGAPAADNGASSSAARSERASLHAVVFMVRHAEKDTGPDPQDPALTDAGRARAACLSDMLLRAGITHVFHSGLQRTEATVAPLAGRLGLTPRGIPPAAREQQLAALRELPRGSVAVVAGHSNTIPALIGELGGVVGELDERGHVPEQTYDRLFEVLLDDGGHAIRVLELRYCQPTPEPGAGA